MKAYFFPYIYTLYIHRHRDIYIRQIDADTDSISESHAFHTYTYIYRYERTPFLLLGLALSIMAEEEDPPPSFEGIYLIDNVVVDEQAGAMVFKSPSSSRWRLSITGHGDTIHHIQDLDGRKEPEKDNAIRFLVR